MSWLSSATDVLCGIKIFLDWSGPHPVRSLSLLTVGVESVWAAVAAALSVFLAFALLSESFYVGKECVWSQNDAIGIQSRQHTTIGKILFAF